MDRALTFAGLVSRRRTDEDIFARALDGDAVAFSEVYRRYSSRVYGYCLARLMDREAATDATQEVFLRLLDTKREDIAEPLAWLFAIARNVSVDLIRKRMRSPELVPADGTEDTRAVSNTTADSEFVAKEEVRTIFLALRRIRPRYRTALILREFHHESSADIAVALGTTRGAVDTLVSRARDSFGRAYAEVADLPEGCRDAVMAVYKRKGSGLDAAGGKRLEQHLAICPRCQQEAKRASRLDGLSSLVPFLVPSSKLGLSPLQKAAVTIRDFPDLAAAFQYFVPPERLTPAAKVATGLLGLSLVVAPVIGAVMPTGDQQRPAPGAMTSPDNGAGTGSSADLGAGGEAGHTRRQLYHEGLERDGWQQHDPTHSMAPDTYEASHVVHESEISSHEWTQSSDGSTAPVRDIEPAASEPPIVHESPNAQPSYDSGSSQGTASSEGWHVDSVDPSSHDR